MHPFQNGKCWTLYQITCNFFQNVFVRHNEVFSCESIRYVCEHAQGLFFNIWTVISFKNKNDGLNMK